MKNYYNELSIVPENEQIIWNTIDLEGFDCFLVGGAVRDMIQGITPHDFDFATNATPDEIQRIFSKGNFRVDSVGASFGVMLVNGVEVATFRGDSQTETGARNATVTYVDTIEEDLSRRDFTINAMAMDMNGNLIDPFGGFDDVFLGDLGGPVIRFVGDPCLRIWEDPNRILRAFRFASRFDGVIEEGSWIAITESLHLVRDIAPERIRLEIIKTLESTKKASIFWNFMRMSGVLHVIFPEMEEGFGHDHGSHHDEDVWLHNMIAGDTVSTRFPLLKLAAYLHDVGKPTSFDPESGTFYEHQHFGADIVRKRLKQLKFSTDEIRYVVNLVLVHMDGTRGMTAKSRRRLKNKLNSYGLEWREYVRLRIADRAANMSRSNFTRGEVRDYINIFTFIESVPLTANDLPLLGGEIIRIFGLTPGPIVGKIQRALLSFVIDMGDEFNNRESLINLVEVEFGLKRTLDNNE